jgi:predicted component of type VI protein secretion system
MNLSLVVLTAGKMQGKVIPISLLEFLIGRDPQCHLRPTSAMISKRHCALLTRGNSVFVQDFGSTNGTAVNDEAVTGERELHHEDRLRVGPLEFRVAIEAAGGAIKRAPMVKAPSAGTTDDEAAAMLLSLQDDGPPPENVDSQGIPEGSTVMETLPQSHTPPPDAGKPPPDKAQAAKVAAGNTSSAAKAILEKYMRRPRAT